MNYWLYITNSDNWKVTKKLNILGASERHKNRLSRMELGDKCLVYVIGEIHEAKKIPAKIVAEYSVASEVFDDKTKIFNVPTYVKSESETFNVRIKIKLLRVFKNSIEFKPLVSQLAFIKNKQRYSSYIRGRAVVKIPEADYFRIISKAGRK